MPLRRFLFLILCTALLLRLVPAFHTQEPARAFGADTAIVVNTTADTPVSVDAFCSLREAIAAANSNAPVGGCAAGQADEADVITFAVDGIFNFAIAGAGEDENATGDYDIHEDLVIRGNGRGLTILDARSLDRLLHVHGSARLDVSSLTLRGGLADGDQGGAALIATGSGMLRLSDVALAGNEAESGGAIFTRGRVELDDSALSGNTARRGGAVTIIAAGRLEMFDSEARDNMAVEAGGVVNLAGGTGLLAGSVLADNLSGDSGGALFTSGGILEVAFSTLTGNDAERGGAAALADDGRLRLIRSTLAENSAGTGGAIFAGDGAREQLLIEESTVSVNRAAGHGGAVAVGEDAAAGAFVLDITTSTLCNNRAGLAGQAGNGGALYLNESMSLFMSRSTLCGNRATGHGGAVYGGGLLDIENTTLSGNSAHGDGGGIYTGGAEPGPAESALILSYVTVTANTSGGVGGGLYNGVQSTLLPVGVIVAGNSAAAEGGDCGGVGKYTVGGANLDGDGSCLGFSLTGDPLLEPLGDYGGPTPTHLPQLESPAVDAGESGICSNLGYIDQRGFPRRNVDGNSDPYDGNACDLGAVERQRGEGGVAVLLPVVWSTARQPVGLSASQPTAD